MSDNEKTRNANDTSWYSGKVTRRRLIGYGAARRRARGHHAGAGAVAGRLRPSQALQDRHPAAAVRLGRCRRQDRARGRADGRRPHQQVGRHQRPAGRAPDSRLRIQARRRPPQGREAGRRGQDRRPRRRVPLQRVPRLHAGVRRGQDRQHGQRVPRHHHHHQQVQPLHLPALRLCPGPGRGDRALPDQEFGQEVAHRLSRLLVGSVDPRRLRRGDQEEWRRCRRHHRHPARHRRHDGVHFQDHRRFRRHLRHHVRRQRGHVHQPGLRPRAHQEVQAGRRRSHGRIRPTCRRSARRWRASSASTATCR